MKAFREQQFNSGLNSHAEDDIEQADSNDLIPLRPTPTFPRSLDTASPSGQSSRTLCFEADAETGQNRIKNEKEQ